MPVDKFGRHYLGHNDDALILVDDIPKTYYETKLLVTGIRYPKFYQLFNGSTSYKVTSPSGTITNIVLPSRVKLFINRNEVSGTELIGKTLNKGDIISFDPDQNKTPYLAGVEFTLRVPTME